jgi:hypothetical protein
MVRRWRIGLSSVCRADRAASGSNGKQYICNKLILYISVNDTTRILVKNYEQLVWKVEYGYYVYQLSSYCHTRCTLCSSWEQFESVVFEWFSFIHFLSYYFIFKYIVNIKILFFIFFYFKIRMYNIL